MEIFGIWNEEEMKEGVLEFGIADKGNSWYQQFL